MGEGLSTREAELLAKKSVKSVKGTGKGKQKRRHLAMQRAFAENYTAIGTPTFHNAYQSAIAAGYKHAYARVAGGKILDSPAVIAEMARIKESRLRRSNIATPEEVLETLTTQLRMLASELVNKEGDLLPLNKMTRDQAQAIAGVKISERVLKDSGNLQLVEVRREYKLVDRQRAAEMLAKYHGIFEADNRQKQPDPGENRLVAFPVGQLSLSDWQAQVMLIMAKQPPAMKSAGSASIADAA